MDFLFEWEDSYIVATRSLEVGNMCRILILGKFVIHEEHFCLIENQFCLLGGGMLGPLLGIYHFNYWFKIRSWNNGLHLNCQRYGIVPMENEQWETCLL